MNQLARPAIRAGQLGPQFGKLWAASAISDLGNGATVVAGALLVASLTGNPVLVAGVAFAQKLPWLLFALVSGALVDRLDRRRVMLAVDVVRTVAIATLAGAIYSGAASVAVIYAVFFVLGTAETLYRTAGLAVVPAVVPAAQLERANLRIVGTHTLAYDLLAAPLGGWLFALAAVAPFLLDVGSFMAAIALVTLMRGAFRAAPAAAPAAAPVAAPARGPAAGAAAGPAAGTARRTLRDEITEGVRWLVRHRLLRTLALSIGVMNLTLAAATSILVLVARDRLGLGSVGYGLLFSAIAVGGIAGSLAGGRLIDRVGASTTLRAGLIIEAATHLVIVFSRSPYPVAAILVLFGAHCALWSIVSMSLRQRLTPAWMLGRINSAYLFLSAGAMALGALLGGILAQRLGLTAPFWLGFVAITVLTVIAWPVFNRTALQATRQAAD